jgi:hypothetical protein
MTEFINNQINDEPFLDEKDVGKKEFIVKQDIVISVQYKILAEDKDEAYEKMLNEYMFDLGVSERDDNKDNVYDFQTKTHGAQQRKEFWTDKLLSDIEKTGKSVMKIYSEEKEIIGKDGKKEPNPDYDEKDFELKVTDVPW